MRTSVGFGQTTSKVKTITVFCDIQELGTKMVKF